MKISILIFLFLFVASAHHKYLSHMFGTDKDSNYPPLLFDQSIDHFDFSNPAVFDQRYYINSDFWKPIDGLHSDAPIFLYIGGEGPLEGPPKNNSSIGIAAKKFNGLIVALEHRFYGESMPFSTDTRIDKLRFLSSSQGLADLAQFRLFIQNKYGHNNKNKWIVVGGSYAGAMSAWFRLKYPHLVIGSWASSPVINAIENFYSFDTRIRLTLGTKCANVVERVSDIVERHLNSSAEIIKNKFVNTTEIPLWNDDLLLLVIDTASIAVQYGYRHLLCDTYLLPFEHSSDEDVFLKVFGDAQSYSTPYMSKETITIGYSDRQWWWQCCSELAYFQTAPEETPLRSRHLNLDYYENRCNAMFPGIFTDTIFANNNYGGVDISGTNIIFVNSIEDPWQEASIKMPLLGNAPENCYSVYIDCEECAHCADLRSPKHTDPPALIGSRNYIYDRINGWIFEEEEDTPFPYQLVLYITLPFVAVLLISLLIVILLLYKYKVRRSSPDLYSSLNDTESSLH